MERCISITLLCLEARDGEVLKQALASPELISPCQISSPGFQGRPESSGQALSLGKLEFEKQHRDGARLILLTFDQEGPS